VTVLGSSFQEYSVSFIGDKVRTIIAGSRSITNPCLIETAVKESGLAITVVISGGARGVDQLGEKYAREHNALSRK